MAILDRDPQDLQGGQSQRLSRRRLLRWGVAAGFGALAAPTLLAACGGSDDSETPQSGSTPSTSDSESSSSTGSGGSGQSSGGDTGDADGGLEVIFAMSSEPSSLDPHKIQGNEEWNALYHIYEPLISRTPDGALRPGLLQSYEAVDDDNRVWHLKLTEGVTFHNGEPWNAEVLKFNFDRIRDNEEITIRQYIAGLDAWEVVDDYTVEITLNTPMALVENGFLQVGVVPKEYLEEVGDAGLNEHPVGTGPFRFVEWKKDEHIRLERFDDYWGEAPVVETGLIRVIPEAASRVAALVSGEVHLIRGVSVFDVERIESTDGTQIIARPGPRMWHLKFDTARETDSPGMPSGPNPFIHREVRQAIYQAINIDDLIASALRGHAMPASQLVPDFVTGHNPAVERLPYDPDRAKALLAEAGFADGFTVRLDVQADKATVGEVIAGFLADLGITVELNAAATSVYRDLTDNRETSFSLGSWGSTMVNTAFDANIHTVDPERGLGRANYGQYSNPELDALIDEARETFDPAAQEKAYQELQRLAMEDVAIVPLYHEGIIVGAAADLTTTPYFNEHVYLFDVRRQ